MRTLEGGCQVPIGARAELHGDAMHMEAVVGSIDGTTIVRYGLDGSRDEPLVLGAAMVDRLLDMGTGEVLADIRAAAEADVGVDKLIET
jgi:hydroxymethylbilane synthase